MERMAVGGDFVKAPITGCWCCGDRTVQGSLLRLGEHPEVGVCFRCVDFLTKRKRAIGRLTHHAPAGPWWRRAKDQGRLEQVLRSRC